MSAATIVAIAGDESLDVDDKAYLIAYLLACYDGRADDLYGGGDDARRLRLRWLRLNGYLLRAEDARDLAEAAFDLAAQRLSA